MTSRSDGSDPKNRGPERSGNYSADRRFDPDSLFQVIADGDNSEQAASAIKRFMLEGQGDQLKQAIALYTRSARAKGKTVEKVLAELNSLSDKAQGRYAHTGELLAPSQLKKLVLTTVLEGFVDEDGPSGDHKPKADGL